MHDSLQPDHLLESHTTITLVVMESNRELHPVLHFGFVCPENKRTLIFYMLHKEIKQKATPKRMGKQQNLPKTKYIIQIELYNITLILLRFASYLLRRLRSVFFLCAVLLVY